jgi:HEAT repeat protein
MTKPIDATLSALFDAERTVRALHDELADSPVDELLSTLGKAVPAALAEPDEAEAALRLVRMAELLGELEGPVAVDLLIDVLGSEHPEARYTAGEQLEDLAFDRFKEVAKGVERALKRLPVDSPALPELPHILAQLPEPGVLKLLGQFLAHEDPVAVAAGIEALVELGDPDGVRLLTPLLGDTRTVSLDEEEEDPNSETTEVTLGELVEEAIDLLSGEEDDAAEGAGRTLS